jgi:hypothetical protein
MLHKLHFPTYIIRVIKWTRISCEGHIALMRGHDTGIIWNHYSHYYYCYCVGFDVLTAVVMKSSIFWDITPCSSLKDNRHFGGTYRLHLHGRRKSRASLALLDSYFQAGFLIGLLFDPEDGGDMFLRNVDWLSMGYSNCQSMELYIYVVFWSSALNCLKLHIHLQFRHLKMIFYISKYLHKAFFTFSVMREMPRFTPPKITLQCIH